MASLLILLFRSLVSRKGLNGLGDTLMSDGSVFLAQKEWEFGFAVQICEQYSSVIWLPSLVKLLQSIGTGILQQEQAFVELHYATEFISYQLQDPEFMFRLEGNEDSDNIQVPICFLEHFASWLFV